VQLIDMLMTGLVIGVSVIGLQAVGLILMVAMLIIPPAAARFWTDNLAGTLAAAGVAGAMSGLLGSALSALVPRLPAGAVIVVLAAAIFALSLVFGVRRGMVVRGYRALRLRRRVARQHLLRAIYEWLEERRQVGGPDLPPVPRAHLLEARSWTPRQLQRELRWARRRGDIELVDAGSSVRLTYDGRRQAARFVRNHRMWELYLITHADIAPSHVDRDADQIEHVLEPGMIEKLEGLLAEQYGEVMPPSPHLLAAEGERGS
jgi:manganese/zinc/iron transport system permease protein